MHTLIPPAMLALTAAPPVVRGEDEADYARLLAQLGAESGAASVIDWMLVKDIADLTWQIARIRRFVSAYTTSTERVGLAAAIQQFDGGGTKHIWEETLERVNAELDAPGSDGGECAALIAKCGVPIAQLGLAHAFFRNLGGFMAAERMLTLLERRRNGALVHMEARRKAFAAALRTASNRVIDAEAVAPPLAADAPLAPRLAAAG